MKTASAQVGAVRRLAFADRGSDGCNLISPICPISPIRSATLRVFARVTGTAERQTPNAEMSYAKDT